MILNYIKQKFCKQKNNENKTTDNSVIFLIDQNNEPSIKIQIAKTDLALAHKFGELLYSINQGHMEEYICRILVDLAKQDVNINQFVQEALRQWISKTNNNSIADENTPIIKPTSFYTNNINE